MGALVAAIYLIGGLVVAEIIRAIITYKPKSRGITRRYK